MALDERIQPAGGRWAEQRVRRLRGPRVDEGEKRRTRTAAGSCVPRRTATRSSMRTVRRSSSGGHLARRRDLATAPDGARADPAYEPDLGVTFQQAVEYRKRQGFNSVSLIAGFPTWAADNYRATFADSRGVYFRNAWEAPASHCPATAHRQGHAGRARLPPSRSCRPEGCRISAASTPRFSGASTARCRCSPRRFRPDAGARAPGHHPALESYFDFTAPIPGTCLSGGALRRLQPDLQLGIPPRLGPPVKGLLRPQRATEYNAGGPSPAGSRPMHAALRPAGDLADQLRFDLSRCRPRPAPRLWADDVFGLATSRATTASIPSSRGRNSWLNLPPYPRRQISSPITPAGFTGSTVPGGENAVIGLRARRLLRARDDVRLGAVGRVGRSRGLYRCLRHDHGGRAERLASVFLAGVWRFKSGAQPMQTPQIRAVGGRPLSTVSISGDRRFAAAREQGCEGQTGHGDWTAGRS